MWLSTHGLRALALIPVFVTALFLLERGRSYYPLPADALAVAAGAVALDGWLRTRARLALVANGLALQAAVIALAGPIVIPFYLTRQLVNSSIWKIGYFKDEIGWPEMTAQVEHAWSALPAADRSNGAVLAHTYGEASALAFYGRGLPTILSGNLSWQFWHPSRLPERFVLTVGYQTPDLEALCRSWTVLARVDNRWNLDNEEHGQPIAACPLGSDWTRLIATDRL